MTHSIFFQEKRTKAGDYAETVVTHTSMLLAYSHKGTITI